MADEPKSEDPADSPDAGGSKIPVEGLPKPEAPRPETEPKPVAASEPSPVPAAPIMASPTSDGPGPTAETREPPAGAPGPEVEEERSLREPFPFIRLLFAVLFGIIASVVFWIILLLSFLQFVTIAIAGEKNDELQQFSRQVANYMKQMFDYMTLASEERPFPFGPFPKE